MKTSNNALLGLRGFLAIFVVIYHIYYSAVLEQYISEGAKGSFLNYLNYSGPIAVNLFFVISGYLIVKSLIHKKTLREFVFNRILRIYPVFLVLHLIIFSIGPLIGYKWMEGITLSQYLIHFLSNLLMLPGILPLPIAQIVAWSLSYEMAFYIVSGAVFWISRNRSIAPSLKICSYALIGLVCLVILYLRPLALFFVVGTLLYLTGNWIERNVKPNRFFYLNGFIFLVLLHLIFESDMNWSSVALSAVISYLFFIPIVTQYGALSDCLQTKLFQYLGKISYSLYMWHTLIMFPLKKVMPGIVMMVHFKWLIFIIYAVLILFLSLLVSHVSYTWIEVKCTNVLKKLLSKPERSEKSIVQTF